MRHGTLAAIISAISLLPLVNLAVLMSVMARRVPRIRDINLARPLLRILRYLSAMPILAVIVLGVFILGVFDHDRLYRAAHAVFLAGVVMTAVFQVIMQSAARGLAIVWLYISGLASEVLILAGAVYFALFRRFATVFVRGEALLPLLTGAIMIVACTALLVAATRLARRIRVPGTREE